MKTNVQTPPAGLNCAQKVLHYYLARHGDANQAVLLHALQGFGSGLGCGKLCGCLAGGAAALSLAAPEGDSTLAKAKASELAAWFEEAFGSTECALLKRPPNGQAPVPCGTLIAETCRQFDAVAAPFFTGP